MDEQTKRWIDLSDAGLALWLMEDPSGEAPATGLLESVDRTRGRLTGLISGDGEWPEWARERLAPRAIDPWHTRVELGQIDAGALSALFPEGRVMEMPRSAFTRAPRSVAVTDADRAGLREFAAHIADRIGNDRDARGLPSQEDGTALFHRIHHRLGFGEPTREWSEVYASLHKLDLQAIDEAVTAALLVPDVRLNDLGEDGRGLFERHVFPALTRAGAISQPVAWALQPANAESAFAETLWKGNADSNALATIGAATHDDRTKRARSASLQTVLPFLVAFEEGPRSMIVTNRLKEAQRIARENGLDEPRPVPAANLFTDSISLDGEAMLVRRGRMMDAAELEDDLKRQPHHGDHSFAMGLTRVTEITGDTPEARAKAERSLNKAAHALGALAMDEETIRASEDRVALREPIVRALDNLAERTANRYGDPLSSMSTQQMLQRLPGRDAGDAVRAALKTIRTAAAYDAAEALEAKASEWRENGDQIPATANERTAALQPIITAAARPLPEAFLRHSATFRNTAEEWLANTIAPLEKDIARMESERVATAVETVNEAIQTGLAAQRSQRADVERGAAEDALAHREPGKRERHHEDAGEVLAGARKHQWQGHITTADLDQMADEQVSEEVGKDNCWPKPDWKAWHAEGVPLPLILFLKNLRDDLPRQPVKNMTSRKGRQQREDDPDKIRRFVAMTSGMHDITQEWLERARDDETVRADFERREDMPRYPEGRAHEMIEAVADLLHANDREAIDEKRSHIHLLPVSRKFQKQWLGGANGPDMLTMRYPWVNALNATYWRGEAALGGKARRGGRQWEQPRAPQLEKVVRDGPDYRKGRHVTGDDLVEIFGFRGIQFGEWLPHKERGEVLDHAYDALMDLADTIGVAPSTIGLGGRLGLAFGARGKGRAAAHYEPTYRVMNLTRLKGAGSLAHEWFHAFDHFVREFAREHMYGARADGVTPLLSDCLGEEYRKINGRYMMPTLSPREHDMLGGKAAEIFLSADEEMAAPRAMEALMLNAIFDPEKYHNGSRPGWRASELREQCGKLDRSNFAYWSRPSEMLARGFEATVYDRLTEQGRQSDYLVAGVQDRQFEDQDRFKGNPVASGPDRVRLRAVFESMFNHALPAFERHLEQQQAHEAEDEHEEEPEMGMSASTR